MANRKWLRARYGDKFAEQSLKVYDAEHYGFATTSGVLKRGQVIGLVRQIEKSPLYRKSRGTHRTKITFTSAGAQYAYGGRGQIKIPDSRFGRNIQTVVHEMAHVIDKGGTHNASFVRVLLKLVREFEGANYERLLRQRLYHTGALRKRKKNVR